MICGTLFRLHRGECGPEDKHGCVLGDGHNSPHAFRGDDGHLWRWEYDRDCTCEDCRTDSWEDACRVYWVEKPNKKPTAKRVLANK